jgi:hypothetical protein
MKKIRKTAFCAVRLDASTGKEWLDTSTITLHPEDTKKEAQLSERYVPDWAKGNPVVRVVKIEIREVE